MIYKDFGDIKLSSLGLGCMRLPVIDGKDSQIDKAAAAEMIAYAMEHGINYYDTAWGYHEGNSETVVGEILSNYPRESFYLASKFPGYDLPNFNKIEKIFERQLEKCKVDYFDFYLFHNVCEMNIESYLDKKFGVYDYLMKQKKNGRIKHLGFSCHGTYDTVKRFLEAYGKDMEFGQIQLNYLDWDFQDAKAKVELFREYNIPIWVMEPLRGGSLARLDEEHEARLKEMRPDESIPAWAFRYLQSIDDVTVVLSGMSNFAQLKENIEIFGENKPLSEGEMNALYDIAEEKTKKTALPCTACHYCTSYCPQEIEIPDILKLYNEHVYTDGGFLAPMAMMAIPKEKQPSACIGCGACAEVCPQNINIPEAMKHFAQMLAE